MTSDKSYSELSIQSADSRFMVRSYMACIHEKVLKAALVCGPEQRAIGVFANLIQGGCLITLDGNYVNRCDFLYRRTALRIGKWTALLILSKDPRCLWQDDNDGLLAGLKLMTETPFLPEWVPAIREAMIQQKVLVKFQGFNPMGSFLECTTEGMDKIVSAGVSSGRMHLQAA